VNINQQQINWKNWRQPLPERGVNRMLSITFSQQFAKRSEGQLLGHCAQLTAAARAFGAGVEAFQSFGLLS
jgi:hypothetical protein